MISGPDVTASRIVGLDLGGTAIKGGAVTPTGEILEEGSIPTRLERGAENLLERAADFARLLGAGGEVPLGIGCPGLIERATGTILESPNLPQIQGLALAAELAQRLELPPDRVRLENDANVAALGELWLGAARGQQNVLVVTLGTGIGGGLILGGRLFAGASGRAGEIGHVSIDPSAPPCASGVPGCLVSVEYQHGGKPLTMWFQDSLDPLHITNIRKTFVVHNHVKTVGPILGQVQPRNAGLGLFPFPGGPLYVGSLRKPLAQDDFLIRVVVITSARDIQDLQRFRRLSLSLHCKQR